MPSPKKSPWISYISNEISIFYKAAPEKSGAALFLYYGTNFEMLSAI